MFKFVSAVLASALLVSSPAAAKNISINDMNRLIDQTNFMVNDGCSGTLIDVKDRLILTANHCIRAQYEDIEHEKIDEKGVIKKEKIRRVKDGTVSQLQFNGGSSVVQTTYNFKVIAVDNGDDRDLALLQVIAPLPNIEAARLACQAPTRLEPVTIVGNPMGVLYSSAVTGIVSSTQRDYHRLGVEGSNNSKEPLVQISGGVIGGNSGGAVYNKSGEIVGVSVLANRTNEILGFAVPLDSIKAFLKAHDHEAIYSYCDQGDAD